MHVEQLKLISRVQLREQSIIFTTLHPEGFSMIRVFNLYNKLSVADEPIINEAFQYTHISAIF